jgi:superfamily II DNA/RNA helicase
MARIYLYEDNTVDFASLNLNDSINKAIAACGYTTPTPIQAKSIPDIMLGKDLVASAQTGTGKTAAFVLPALHRLSLQQASKKTRILILTPTRELANQILKATSTYGKFLRFNVVSLVGGMPYHHQIKDLARGADIIVATPGRLLDHMEQKRVDLSNIEMLVLDEADRMLDMGFIDDVEYIAKLTPANRQTLLFSATVDKQLTSIVKHLLKDPVRIDLSHEKLAAPKITQELYKANNPHHKIRILKHILTDANIFKAIIFSATKINADRLTIQLRELGFAAAALHGDLKQNVRTRTVEQLRNGKIQFLIATDVAARGIDISDVTHVINFDLPRFCEDYVHRIGRTGRAGKSGIAISLMLPSDLRHLQRIERFTGQRLKLITNYTLDDSSTTTTTAAIPANEKLSLRKATYTGYDRDDSSDSASPKKRYSTDKGKYRGNHDKHQGSERRSSFAGRSEGGSERRSSFAGRSEGGNERRSSFAGRSEGGSERRSSFAGRSEGGNERRSSFAGRSEGGSERRSSFAGRSEGGNERRSSFAGRSEGGNERRSSFAGRSEGGNERRSSFAGRSEGGSERRSSFAGRSEGGNERRGSFAGRSSEAGSESGRRSSFGGRSESGFDKRRSINSDRSEGTRSNSNRGKKPFVSSFSKDKPAKKVYRSTGTDGRQSDK